MAAIILTYRLLPGVTPADFEHWVATVDQPTMRGLARVERFETYRVAGLLMGEGAPSVQYVEVFDIPDLTGFTGEDMAGPTVQSVLGQFMGFADRPEITRFGDALAQGDAEVVAERILAGHEAGLGKRGGFEARIIGPGRGAIGFSRRIDGGKDLVTREAFGPIGRVCRQRRNIGRAGRDKAGSAEGKQGAAREIGHGAVSGTIRQGRRR